MPWYFQPRFRAAITNCASLGCRAFGFGRSAVSRRSPAGVSRASRFGVGSGRVPEGVQAPEPLAIWFQLANVTVASFLKIRWESRASGLVPIRLCRLDVPTDPVLSLLRLCCDFAR